MPIFKFARRPPQWLRVVLAAMLLGFALNSVAHAAHGHEPATPGVAAVAHGVSCGYCVSFTGMSNAPHHSYATLDPPSSERVPRVPAYTARSVAPYTCAQPRAPPVPEI